MRRPRIEIGLRIGCALLACALYMAPVSARTWRVEKDGSGDFTVIQDALDAAAEGDSVLIGPGRYDDFRLFDPEPVGSDGYAIIGIHKSDLTVVGSDSSQVVIGPVDPISYIDDKDTYGIAVNHELDGARFENLTIEHARWGAALVSFGSFARCRFQNNTWSNLFVNGGSGMRYERCSFSGNGVSVLGALDDISDIVFSHCVFGPQADLLNIQTVQNAMVEFCLFSSNGSGVQFSNGSTGVVRYSRFENNYDQHIISTLNSTLLVEHNQLGPGSGFSIVCHAARMTARYNVIGGATLNTVFLSEISIADQVRFSENDILNGGQYSVKAFGSGLTSPPIELDFSNNYWGTTDTSQLDAWIWDDADSHRTVDPVVRYLPMRDGSIPTAITSISRLKGLFDGPR